MTHPADNRENRIFESLKKCAPSALRLGGGRWSLALVNGKSLGVTARAVEEWLLLDAPLTDRVDRAQLWDLLRLNRALDGASKLVLMGDNRSIHLRADVVLPRDEDFDGGLQDECDDHLTQRLLEACAAMKAAFRRFRGQKERGEPGSISPLDASQQSEIKAAELKDRCADAGWPFIERSAEKLVFDLETQGGFYQAVLEQHRAGARVWVELARWEALGELNRQALGALLLKTGGRVKLARPSVEENEALVAARFEIDFNAMPSPGELKHALSSLSVACTLCGREASVLQDEAVARAYLASSVEAKCL